MIVSLLIRAFERLIYDYFASIINLILLIQPLKTLHQEFTQSKEAKNSYLSDDEQKFFQDDNGETLEMISSGRGDPIVCRLEPFNLCYRFDASGTMHPIGNRRPVRLIRVYK